MAFQRQRPILVPGTGARTWPNSRPAGLSTLEKGFNRRAVSTTELRSRNLPPMEYNVRVGNRKVGIRTETADRGQQAWAKTWARMRAEQTNVHTKGCTNHKRPNPTMSHLANTGLTSASKRNEIVAMNEKEAMVYKRLKGIYANSTDKSVRAQRLKDSIVLLQSRTLHSEIDHSLKEYKKREEEDKRNRSELKRLRERYSRDKDRRNRKSYLSLNALESPQVSRHAYGLPEEGQEHLQSGVAQQARERLRDIWKSALKRAALVDKMVNMRTQQKVPLPEIKIRRQSVSQKEVRMLRDEENREDKRRRNSIEMVNQLEMILGEIDVMSTVVSDSDEEGLEDDEHDIV